jgi:hypothetical protein
MRMSMRGSFAALLLGISVPLAACDAPKDSTPAGAAVVEAPARADPMPAPVAATVKRLHEIAAQGSYRDLAKLAEAAPDFRSNNAGLSHTEFWNLKMRTGDFPMAHVEKLLSYNFTVEPSSQGKIYIWPWMATLKREEITPLAAREIDRLLGEGQADALRKGAIWPGYVLGIREDGLWLYFLSGSG